MKLTAIDASTGRVLMSHAGSLDEASFRKTVAASFPSVDPSKVTIIVNGHIRSSGGQPIRMDTTKKGLSVIWKGSYSDMGGYANMNREIVFRLQHHGIAAKIDMLRTAPQVDPMTHTMLRAYESIKLHDEATCPMVVGFTPMPVQKAKRRIIFYTMMETNGLHKEFVNRCNTYANEIWVPCNFYERVFREAGIVRPITKIPLGVNHAIYVPDAKPPALTYEEMPSGSRVTELPDAFRFMSLFGWSYRKGPDVLCKSFLGEFEGDEAVLVIYSRYMGSSAEQHKDFIRNEIRQYYSQCSKKTPARIYVCGDSIPISDLPGCYASSDAFVFCSRGEGFGLPVVEAGACGIPIISAYNTAMLEYLDDDVAYCVPPEDNAIANELTWITEYYRDQKFAVYGEKSIGEFGRLMRKVMVDPDDAANKARRFRERILSKYTWDICAAKVAENLKKGAR